MRHGVYYGDFLEDVYLSILYETSLTGNGLIECAFGTDHERELLRITLFFDSHNICSLLCSHQGDVVPYCSPSCALHYWSHTCIYFMVIVEFHVNCIHSMPFIPIYCPYPWRYCSCLFIWLLFEVLTPTPGLQSWFICITRLYQFLCLTPYWSFSSSLNGSVDHQDDVSSPTQPSQSRVVLVLDGSGPNPNGQSNKPRTLLLLKTSSKSEWEVIVILNCPILSQNFVLSFEKVSLQRTFP